MTLSPTEVSGPVVRQICACRVHAGDTHDQLIHTLGLSEEQVAKMDKAQAIAVMTEHWTRPTD